MKINKETNRLRTKELGNLKFKLTIDNKITEQQLIENCLTYYHSGYDYKLLLFFYAFGKRWKADKLIYYINLIRESKDE